MPDQIRFFLIALGAFLWTPHVKAEEQSITISGVVDSAQVNLNASWNATPNSLIDGCFKCKIASQDVDNYFPFTIDLQASYALKTAFSMNSVTDDNR